MMPESPSSTSDEERLARVKEQAERRMGLHDQLPRACRRVAARACANIEIGDPIAAHSAPDYYAAIIRDRDEQLLCKIEKDEEIPPRTNRSRSRI